MSRISRKFSNIFSNYLLKFKWTQGDHTHVIHKSAVFTQEKWTLRYIHNCTEMLTAALFIIIKKKKRNNPNVLQLLNGWRNWYIHTMVHYSTKRNNYEHMQEHRWSQMCTAKLTKLNTKDRIPYDHIYMTLWKIQNRDREPITDHQGGCRCKTMKG